MLTITSAKLAMPLAVGRSAALESESLTAGITRLIQSGFDIKEEPFLRGTLTCMRSHILQVAPCTSRLLIYKTLYMENVVHRLSMQHLQC